MFSSSANILLRYAKSSKFSSIKRTIKTIPKITEDEIKTLREIEMKMIWLSTFMIHNANVIRPSRDGLKVGGHAASTSSLSTILTALYVKCLEPHDRIAVKPHASPGMHALYYLMGKQSLDQLKRFRSFGGAQSYPSRTKDSIDVDFSTGSVGLGAAITTFSAMVQDFLIDHDIPPKLNEFYGKPAQMITIIGDAEMDEGNIPECLLEAWKFKVKNNLYIIDYNRQSLDKVVETQTFRQIEKNFRMNGFKVNTLKYGKKLRAAFDEGEGGKELKRWINECCEQVYSTLTFQGGAAFRRQILNDRGKNSLVKELLDKYDDSELFEVITDLGGHCMSTVIDALNEVSLSDEPTCIIAYTVKGYGLPIAGHRDNHALFMNEKQIQELRDSHGIKVGQEWEKLAGMRSGGVFAQKLLQSSPLVQFGSADEPINTNDNSKNKPRVLTDEKIEIPEELPGKFGSTCSTQTAFGQVLLGIGRAKKGGAKALADRMLTTAPDVTTSTNLIGFVNQRGVYSRDKESQDHLKERKILSLNQWNISKKGAHIPIGISEMNLMLLLSAAGLSTEIFGRRLFPVGTLYDPFISRSLDALNYGCYQNSRFMVVATPSGITLGPEGGAHQSICTPLIGMSQPNMMSWEPCFADELKIMMRWGFEHMQAEAGGSVYFRLSTRNIKQPDRELTADLQKDILNGAYWLNKEPDALTRTVIVSSGALTPEAMEAVNAIEERDGKATCSHMSVTSYDKLYNESIKYGEDSHAYKLMSTVPIGAKLVTVLDGFPASLSWLGSVVGHKTRALGITEFGQSGDLIDLYKYYGVDTESIVRASETATSVKT